MLSFIAENIGSLLVLLALAVTIGLILFFTLRARKQGKHSCGAGCSACPMAGKCHAERANTSEGNGRSA